MVQDFFGYLTAGKTAEVLGGTRTYENVIAARYFRSQ